MNRSSAYLILIITTCLAYWGVWRHGFLSFDDSLYVYENPRVFTGVSVSNATWAWKTWYGANWHPLTWLSLQLDASLFGVQPWGFHTVNLLWHSTAALLLFEAIRHLTGRPGEAFCVALLFAIHPAHVESVAWVSSRKDVLFATFGFASLLAWSHYARGCGRKWYLASLVLFAVCLLAKQMLVTLPCLLLVLDVWPLRRLSSTAASLAADHESPGSDQATRISLRRAIVEKLPFLGLTVTFSIIVYAAQAGDGAVVSLDRLPLSTRIENAVAAYAEYLSAIFAPTRLAAYYTRTLNGSESGASLVIAAAVLVLISTIAAQQFRNRPRILAGWCWFLGTLVPVIGLVQVGFQQKADRYLYFPAIGIYLAVVFTVASLIRGRGVSRTVAILAVLMLVGLTFRQQRTWRNDYTLWSHATAVVDNNYFAESELALYLMRMNRDEEAERHFLRALTINPEYPNANSNYGTLLARRGQHQEAIRLYERSLAVRPGSSFTLLKLAQSLMELRRFDDAEPHLMQAMRIADADPVVWYWMGTLMRELGRPEKARASFERAIQYAGEFKEATEELRKLDEQQAQAGRGATPAAARLQGS